MKTKISLFFLAFLLLFIGGYLVYSLLPQDFIYPQLPHSFRLGNLESRLTQKVDPNPSLDFSQSQQLASLENLPYYLVFNFATGQVYAAKAADQPISPASFTKLLTAQTALDLADSHQFLTATTTSVDKEPTVLGLKAGEQLSLDELVRASIATSANDAAATIGEGVSALYDLELADFVSLMNYKAGLLGMDLSHFVNPEGYDSDNQYSTLVDIAKLVNNSLTNYPLIISAASSDRDDLQETSTHSFYYLPNWNGLLKIYPGVTGLKIAYTETAGHSTIVTASQENTTIVAIVSGADSIPERDLAAAALLDVGFVAENIQPANLTKANLQKRYNQWSELATQIRAEIEARKNEETSAD